MLRIVVLLSAAAIANVQAQSDTSRKATVLTHATVIDGTGTAAQPDMTLVIEGKQITFLGQDGTVDIPTDAQVIDARSKFITPGLWDMHVHLSWTKASALPALRSLPATARPSLQLSFHTEWRRNSAARNQTSGTNTFPVRPAN